MKKYLRMLIGTIKKERGISMNNVKKSLKKGFTLAELLIVVAIIGVLVAIAIPVFSAQLKKSKMAADKANLRAWYAEVTSDYLMNPDTSVTCPEPSFVSNLNYSASVHTAGELSDGSFYIFYGEDNTYIPAR